MAQNFERHAYCTNCGRAGLESAGPATGLFHCRNCNVDIDRYETDQWRANEIARAYTARQATKRDVEGYQNTIARLEPEIWSTDTAAFGTSIAISLKRIADSLERLEKSATESNLTLEFIRAAIAHR